MVTLRQFVHAPDEPTETLMTDLARTIATAIVDDGRDEDLLLRNLDNIVAEELSASAVAGDLQAALDRVQQRALAP